MILLIAGCMQLLMGILLAVFRPRHQSGFWGYTSYLAGVNAESFRLAQRMGRFLYCLAIFGRHVVSARICLYRDAVKALFASP